MWRTISAAAWLCSLLSFPARADDVENVVGRSAVILDRPNLLPSEAMPLGNGRLGIAVWGAEGLTIQLNRSDTLPRRLSPGQIAIPGLERLMKAPDFTARLDLYNGEFSAQGGGMRVAVYVQPATDLVVVDVHGVSPREKQTATLRVWKPRRPEVWHNGSLVALAETWVDNTAPGASGETFGSLSVLTARARDVQAHADDALNVSVSFLPESDGSFRVLAAAPHWAGGDVLTTAHSAITAPADFANHRRWWNGLWHRAGLMTLQSQDGSAEYMEDLRLIDLFTAAAESGGTMPGSQAGVGDLFSSHGDFHQWDPSAFWHWNLRMQVAANLGAGLAELNEPYFRLYRDNLPNIERWTASRMGGKPGACVPETMRFNGVGIESETGAKSPGLDCDAGSEPFYNARTLSTGAEISWWIWQQYRMTGDRHFLETNYPVMAAAARFLLAYSRTGADGFRHTSPSNAHENQWDVHDPTTDICAMKTLFAHVAEAAQILGRDRELQAQAQAALGQMLDWPRTDVGTLRKQLTAAEDAQGETAIAQSYQQDAPVHNSENVGLEPVWPYALIGDAGPQHQLAVRTYRSRPNKMQNDWSYDPLDAARLGLADEVKNTLLQLTKKYQTFPSGMASFVGPEFYIEQLGVVATALEEALVADEGGLLRIASGWPRDWDADGTVFVEQESRVHVQIRSGTVAAVQIIAGYTGRMRLRNPWSSQTIQISTGGEGGERLARDGVLELAVERGKSYLLQNVTRQIAPLDTSTTNRPKFLGTCSIGLARIR